MRRDNEIMSEKCDYELHDYRFLLGIPVKCGDLAVFFYVRREKDLVSDKPQLARCARHYSLALEEHMHPTGPDVRFYEYRLVSENEYLVAGVMTS